MPPQKRTSAKAKDTVKVDPPSAAQPRTTATSLPKKEVDAALEQSAEFIQQQSQPPTDVHPKPTTPSSAEVDAALEQSAEFMESQVAAPDDVHPKPTTPSQAEVDAAVEQAKENLEAQGQLVSPDTSTAPSARDLSQDAAPVSAGGTDTALAAAPVSGARDKTQDASPVFAAPLPNMPPKG
jgi:hypothetical protein